VPGASVAVIKDFRPAYVEAHGVTSKLTKVTLRCLLSMTAGVTVRGFRGYRYTESVPTLLQVLDGRPPANSAPIVVDLVPGTEFRYSGGETYLRHEGANDGFRGDGAVVMTNSDRALELSEAIFRLLGRKEGWPGA